MLNDDPNRYRWQDHVITPRRAAANLLATALVVFVVGAAVAFTHAGPSRLPTAHVAVSECTPPLSQLAKRPAKLHTTRDLL